MKISKWFKVLSGAVSAVVLAAGVASAGPPSSKVAGTIMKPRILTHKVDLKVYSVGSTQSVTDQSCSYCDGALSRVDAINLPNLAVAIEDAQPFDPNDRWDSVEGKVTVTYFDMVRSRMVTKTVPFTISWRNDVQVVIENHPVLVKRSVGITAEAALLIPHNSRFRFVELNPSNNRKEVHASECVASKLR